MGYQIEGHKHLLIILLSVFFTLKLNVNISEHMTQLIIACALNNTFLEN